MGDVADKQSDGKKTEYNDSDQDIERMPLFAAFVRNIVQELYNKTPEKPTKPRYDDESNEIA